MAYDYLVVVDFQVSQTKQIADANEQEGRQVVDGVQLFVRPTMCEDAALEYIASSRGDDAARVVRESKGLQHAVQEFNDYLYRSFMATNKDFCLTSFGQAPIKRWLWGKQELEACHRDGGGSGWGW
ncbi:hypothetical protein GUITHDRAFT_131754 [Guillardia theta CCMP2712]|uniref:Uncharacterized protein n=1 Tax=Guillardia theta (strain CCMP2712) TaxID=905079 RepID=L1K2W5_GUITC|nr:hypothetical protein GUITHDRAFT_131754 [Guillardia theta CCMP2712]EKX54713.1 hypothetical protein GUITHDRAFT_131754 [Guillardia theta CCMP2712]|eukprot:XP_005841693.1 hypothetical protein GUITHDRAFT_131754 [Guillardia theta CCMP2712]